MSIFSNLFHKKELDEVENVQRQENEITEKTKEYLVKFNEDDAVGWDAIDNELKKLYKEGKDRHYASIIKYSLGGEDPLDGISVFDNQRCEFHRHLISYGMSELYYNPESADSEFSRWGFEFTMRVTPYKKDKDAENQDGSITKNEPYWVMNLMNNLARYVYDSEKYFEAYHFIPTNSPIRIDSETKLCGLIFVPDTELNTIITPHGEVQFLQMVGITQNEINWLLEKPDTLRVKELANKMQVDNPLLITDLRRTKEYV